jgi:hypothetical protein
MKIIVSAAALIAFAGAAAAQSYGYGSNSESHYVGGYTRQNGTVVQPHYQTNPNSTTDDNYETRGNYNPYNSQYGTRSPY